MLQSIRDSSQSIVAKVIVGLIIVTFALFGVESLVSLTAESNAPATVNGEEITQQELYQATELQRRQLLSQMGENADPALLDDSLVSSMVLDSLIEQKSLLLAAEDKNMLISERMIDQMIINTPDFQVEGQFNRDRFEATLRNAGFTPLSYRNLLKKERLIEQERNAYQLSAFVIPAELKRIITLDRQTRDISYFIFPLDDVEKNLTVSDEEINAKYEAERTSLMTEEQVAIEYILLNKNDLRDNVVVSEEELKAQYDQFRVSFQAEDQRHVAHILVEITPDQDDAAALAKVVALQARIKAGEEFSIVASTDSDDIGSSAAGGDLGTNGKGVFADAFEQAMYSLDVNQVSEPVRTEFGYHLIKVMGITKAETPSFAEIKQDLTDDILTRKVENIYVERLELMADITFSSGDLIEPSEVMNLPVMTSKPFGRSGGDLDITQNAKVIGAAFSSDLIQDKLNSSVIELDRERTVVVRVKAYSEPREQTLAEVADELKQQLIKDQASEVLALKAQEAVDQINAGEAVDQVAQGQLVVNLEAVSRASGELPIEVRSVAFALANPDSLKSVVSSAELPDGSVAVVLLKKVNMTEVQLTDEETQSMGAFLGSRIGQQEYQSLVAELKNAAEIEKK
ncbi:SurA N-terminal domain-containing protein [Neptunomonas antarctica]|uniref:Periplasmic chaperone PpiD n=1 Tax=Neptunomonas antarctica TaxID=619304 RepID=A0A1N7JUW4_9GAMM|nr:SurA N-terminal domain-containing protein [Neptunomonas antarctica]SIS53123.1 peptidyl-prolyl cis-trans isomerase D [Neptunomonas antarctica]